MTQDPIFPLDPLTPFNFHCGPERACFNECCRDLSQAITPYDGLRLKTALELTSAEFLGRYTTRQIGPESGLPVVILNPAPGPEKRCPFVTPQGCGVYDHRPASCRIYPLMRAVSRSRETGRLTEHFAMLCEPHCQGFEKGTILNTSKWMASQDLAEYNRLNDGLMEIIALKNQHHPGPLSMSDGLLFYQSLYDLDHFRRLLFEGDLQTRIALPAEILEKAKGDDSPLLEIAYQWVKRALFA